MSKTVDPIDKLVADLHKKGANIEMASDIPDTFDWKNAVSTGSLLLDWHLGTCGIPAGMFMHIFGDYSHGKSTLAINIARQFLQQGKKVLYVDVENTMKNTGKSFFLRNNLTEKDLKNLILLVPTDFHTVANQISKFVAEDIPLVVIDTIAAIANIDPNKDDNDSSKAAPLGQQAKSMNEMLNKLSTFRKRTSFLLLNQERDNIVTHGNPRYAPKNKAPGGRALGFYAGITVELNRLGNTEYVKRENGRAMEVLATITKNKYFDRTVGSSTSLYFLRDGASGGRMGIDQQYDLINMAAQLGIIEIAGPWLTWISQEGEIIKAQGFSNFMEKFSEDGVVNPNHPDLVGLYKQTRAEMLLGWILKIVLTNSLKYD